MQKNRHKLTLKTPSLKLGGIGFVFGGEGRIEIKNIFQLKKLVKKLRRRRPLKKRRKLARLKKMWFFLFPNFIISKKSKNSRMGKGKGEIQRWTIRVRCGLLFMEFFGLHFKKVEIIKQRIQQRLLLKIIKITKQEFFYSTIKRHNSQKNYALNRHFL